MSILDQYKNKKVIQQETLANKENTELEARIDLIMKVFEDWLDDENPRGLGYHTAQKEVNEVIELFTGERISAVEVKVFSEECYYYKELNNFDHLGVFLTGLMQVAYNRGEDDFMISTKQYTEDIDNGRPLHWLGTFLHAEENRLLNLTVEGDVGRDFGSTGCHLNLIVKGNAGDKCLAFSHNSEVMIYGNAGVLCGYESNECDLYLEGTANFQGGFKATNCNFHSPDYALLSEIAATRPKGCKCFHIQPDGTAKRVYF